MIKKSAQYHPSSSSQGSDAYKSILDQLMRHNKQYISNNLGEKYYMKSVFPDYNHMYMIKRQVTYPLLVDMELKWIHIIS